MKVASSVSTVDNNHVLRSAALFMASNILILAFGWGRIVEAVNLRSDLDLAANVAQVFFSGFSLLAITGHVMGSSSRMPLSVIKAAVIISIPLGWFVFFVHLANGVQRVQDGAPQFQTGLALGVLGFIANCGASFGSQTLLGLQVTRTQEGHSATHTKKWFRKRQAYYIFLYMLFAVACLGVGVVTLNDNNGHAGNVVAWRAGTVAPEGEAPAAEGEAPAAEGEAPAAEGEAPAAEGEAPAAEGEAEGHNVAGAGFGGPGIYVPFIVAVPGLTISLGVMMLVNGLWHIARLWANEPSALYVMVSMLVWVFQVTVNSMASQALSGGSYGAVVVGMLSLPLSFMPVYLDTQALDASTRIATEPRSGGPATGASETVEQV